MNNNKNGANKLDKANDMFMGKSYGEGWGEGSMSALWGRYKASVVRVLFIVLLTIVSMQIFNWVGDYQRKKMQEEYLKLEGTEALLSFAKKHHRKPLGGFIFLELADQAYAEGRYAESQELYQNALDGLGVDVLRDRANLGIAMTKLQDVDPVGGLKILEEMAKNKSVNMAIRQQAYYQQFILSIARKDYAGAKGFLATIESLDARSPWAQRGQQIQRTIPELM